MFIPRSCVPQTLYTLNQCGAKRQNRFLCQNQIKVFVKYIISLLVRSKRTWIFLFMKNFSSTKLWRKRSYKWHCLTRKISTSQNEQTSAIVMTKRRQKTAIKSFLMITRCSSTSLWVIHSIFINTLNGSSIQFDRELEYEVWCEMDSN